MCFSQVHWLCLNVSRITAAAFIAAAIACSGVRAQTPTRPHIALVIGVSAYKYVPALPNPANDARAVADALSRLGFSVDAVIDPDRGAMESAIRRLGQHARGADAAVIFYAGHALEVGGHNWLLPTGTNPATERDLRYEALDMDGMLEQLDGTAGVSIVIVDACRDNPFRVRFGRDNRGVTPAGGLAPTKAATGTLIAFATAPGMVAQDGKGAHSPFTTSLLHHIETPGLEVRGLMTNVRREVREATGGQQVPWEYSALEGDFYFKPAAAVLKASPLVGTADRAGSGSEAELVFWQGVRDSTDPADLHAFLDHFPAGTFAALARNRLARLSEASPAPQPPTSLLDNLLRVLEQTGDRVAAPYSASWAQADVRSYVSGEGHKAIAVEPSSGRLFRWTGLTSSALAEQLVLESCLQSYGGPCVLVASDDTVRSVDPRTTTRQTMPRITYAGVFRPEMVPMTRLDALPDAVGRYSSMAAPKALALRAFNTRFSTGTGATQGAAEAAALATCNADPSPAPCFLYASGDQVILPQRRTEAPPGAGAAR